MPVRLNVQMGFRDATGFHPIRGSNDYSEARAGEGAWKKPAKKTAKKTAKTKTKKRNVEMGFRDASGVFHPIRASADYSQAAASEGAWKKAKPKTKAKAKRKRNESISEGFYDQRGIFHPIRSADDYDPEAVGESRQYATRKRKDRRNPETESAVLYEAFHGVPSTQTLEIEETQQEHEHLALLGRLVDCWCVTVTGFLAHFEFDEQPPVWCASSEDGRQLYFVGGDQDIDLAAFKMEGHEWCKDRMVIGQFAPPMCGTCGVEFDKRGQTFTCPKCGKKVTYEKHGPKDVVYNLGYHTSKKFDKEMEEFDYQHDLGEETGVRPMLEFDPRSKHLYVTGGQYRIEQPLLGTSPGIEN